MKTFQIDKSEVIRKAMTEWFKSGETVQPSLNTSELMEHAGKKYVVLVNVNGPFAVYQIKKNGSLKRIQKWPTEFYRLGMYE